MRGSSSESHAPGNRAKTKSNSGWAAFVLKQTQKQQGLESGIVTEAYPSLLSNSPTRSLSNKNEVTLEKPFSSVVVASTSTSSLMEMRNKDLQKRVLVTKSSPDATHNIESGVSIEEDERLMQDVLASAKNNVEEAQSLLGTMFISENESAQNYRAQSSYGNDTASINIQSVSLEEKANANPIPDDSFGDGCTKSKMESSSRLLQDIAKSLPIEPELELEEGDIYLMHRRNAIRMIRSASRHSKAANDAYERGDHLSANLFSLKAQEEWSTAEKLNARAAVEILSVRNNINDPWTLDLHGLHAAEAVQALQEHLQKVETLGSSISVATENGLHQESGTLLSSSVQSTTQVGRQHSSAKERPRLLQAITGKGNHSQGEAALPSAIRNFLTENGYHFDDARPGVIMIRPKFRRQ